MPLIKDPDESSIYSVDFSDVLATGETISSIVVTSTPSGLTIGTPVANAQAAEFRVSGGTSNVVYTVDVVITTSASSTYNKSIEIAVMPASWETEMVTMIRFLINDLTEPYTYSDSRLKQLVIISAQFVSQELTFLNDYIVNFGDLLISPDPTAAETRDNAFINLVVLKAACMADQSSFRANALLEGLTARLGPANLTVTGRLNGFMNILKTGPCKAYEELKRDYQYSDLRRIHAIFSPFVGNNFDPSHLNTTAVSIDDQFERR